MRKGPYSPYCSRRQSGIDSPNCQAGVESCAPDNRDPLSAWQLDSGIGGQRLKQIQMIDKLTPLLTSVQGPRLIEDQRNANRLLDHI